MREFLEDAEAHRKDGYRAAQSHARQQAPKRFYKDVTIGEGEDGFARRSASAWCLSESTA